MFIVENNKLANPRFIINFPTKRHWRGKSHIEDIELGLKALVHEIRQRHIHSIAIPPLGSGLGGLDWLDVRPRIEKALGPLDQLKVVIFEPDSSAHGKVKSREVPAMTPGRAALVVLMHRYLSGLLDPFVTLLEVHKLMYFMQEAGEQLKLQYVEAPYGPYAENLRHVLRVVEGHLVSGYADGGDEPNKQLELVPGAVIDANEFLSGDKDVRDRFDRVAQLVEGFETPFGLELLSTVHWVVSRSRPNTIDEVVTRTYAWNDRKRRFSPDQIKLALKVLSAKGWMASEFADEVQGRVV